MNVVKTNVMIITNDKEEMDKTITIDGNTVKHSDHIKILGVTINKSLDWNTHIRAGRGSLLFQLKQRLREGCKKKKV